MKNKMDLNDFFKLIKQAKTTGQDIISVKADVLLDLGNEINKNIAINSVLIKTLENLGVSKEELKKVLKEIEGGIDND